MYTGGRSHLRYPATAAIAAPITYSMQPPAGHMFNVRQRYCANSNEIPLTQLNPV
jgi:hypothetical protein